MPLLEKKLSVADLRPGMYVSKLDRPWCETPFPIQGFHIRSLDEVEQVRSHCAWVVVDFQLSRQVEYDIDPDLKRSLNRKTQKQKRSQPYCKPVKFQRHVYPVVNCSRQQTRKDIRIATQVKQRVVQALDHVVDHLETGETVDIESTRQAARGVVATCIKNPDALIWLTRIEQANNHLYSQSLNAAVWGVVYARHLGMKPEKMETLVTALLLAKVGVTRLPEAIFDQSHAEPKQQEVWQSYVHHSVDILSHCQGMSREVLSIVATHQERIDGSGFPNQLMGEEIPLLGRIAGIVIDYEELTNPFDFDQAKTSLEATAHLYNLRDDKYPADLVEEFIRAIGIYPAGTIVELTNGQIGVITHHDPDHRLRPRVQLMLDPQQRPLRKKKELDLQSVREDGQGTRLDILKSHPKGAFGIDPAEVVNPGFWAKLSGWF